MPVRRITIQNRTGRPLVPYLMVQTSAGLRRQAQAGLVVPAGGSYEVDPGGSDTVFYDAQGDGDGPHRGVLIEFEPRTDEALVASTVYGYPVPPDEAHNDPTNAPLDARRIERRLAPKTTAVTISLGLDFAVSFDEHGGAVATSP